MLADADRIFTNLYGFQPWNLDAARKRGDWEDTKSLLALGHDAIVDAIKASGRPEAFTMRPTGKPPLRSRLSMALSSQRPTTLTQHATQALIRETAKQVLQA